MEKLKQRVVMYHGGCRDGFGAAWAAHCRFKDNADYIPITHHQPLPEFETESDLWFLDICPRAQVLVSLLDGRHRVHILDHHVTTEEVVESIQSPFLEVAYDVERSGAVIAWEYFFPRRKVPKLLRYIEDRDLWKWSLDGTEEVTEALSALKWTFPLFDRLHKHTSELDQLAKAGHLMVAFKKKCVTDIVKRARFQDIGGHQVPVVNSDSFMSTVGAALAEAHPGAAFSAVWFELQDGRRKWSLRSIGEFSVAEVAQQYGGGGHKNAAGFVK